MQLYQQKPKNLKQSGEVLQLGLIDEMRSTCNKSVNSKWEVQKSVARRHVTKYEFLMGGPKKTKGSPVKTVQLFQKTNVFRLDIVKVCNCSRKTQNPNNLQKFSTLA